MGAWCDAPPEPELRTAAAIHERYHELRCERDANCGGDLSKEECLAYPWPSYKEAPCYNPVIADECLS